MVNFLDSILVEQNHTVPSGSQPLLGNTVQPWAAAVCSAMCTLVTMVKLGGLSIYKVSHVLSTR